MNNLPQPADRSAAVGNAPAPQGADTVKTPKKSRLPLIVGAAIVGAFVTVVGWKVYGANPDIQTDDARITAHYATIAPRVAGEVVTVAVEDNQPVRAGQLLVTLDDRDYRTAVDRAQSQLDKDIAQVGDAAAAVQRQPDVIAQNSAQVLQIEAQLTLAQANATRYRNLAAFGSGSKEDTQAADAKLGEQSAQLAQVQAAVRAAQHQSDILKAQQAAAVAAVHADEAELEQAKLNLSYTRVIAPVDGVVGARAVEPGNYVSPGSALMALVPAKGVYVEAQYREVELKHMQPGQHVRVHVDAYNIDLDGIVDSVPPATGAVFAPIAPDNATGNFTKIVQRLPVKIVLDGDAEGREVATGLLRPGMSVEPTIDTKPVESTGVARPVRSAFVTKSVEPTGVTKAAAR